MDLRSKIRLKNTLELLKSSGLNNKEFAQKIGVAATYFGQIKKGARNIGNRIAPEIEMAFGKSKGWLDVDHSNVVELSPVKLKNKNDNVLLEQYSASGGMGSMIGIDGNHDTVINTIELSRQYLSSMLGTITSAKNVKLMAGIGDSMEGVFNSGDTLFVDTGVVEFVTEGTYVIHFDDHIWIKRIARNGRGGYKIISSNKSYDPVEVNKGDESFKIIGLVLGVLNLKKLV